MRPLLSPGAPHWRSRLRDGECPWDTLGECPGGDQMSRPGGEAGVGGAVQIQRDSWEHKQSGDERGRGSWQRRWVLGTGS